MSDQQRWETPEMREAFAAACQAGRIVPVDPAQPKPSRPAAPVRPGGRAPEITGDPAERCTALIWPSWAPGWTQCGSPVSDGRCVKYGHTASRAPEDDPDLPVGTEITLHVTGRVVSARQGTLTLAVELPDGSAEDVTVDLTAAGVSTTIPSLTRLCGWPGCGRTYQAHHGPDAPGWTRISGLAVLCPDHTPA